MIAKAIGPQNTVGAIGINPRTVEIAVSMIGRKRESVPSTTASQVGRPSARSVSICSMRITALRAIMPISARMPRIATKPSGLPEDQQRRDNADEAHRNDAQDQGQAAETVQLSHQEQEHQEQHQGHLGEDRGLRLRAFLDGAAGVDAIAFRQACVELLDRRSQRPHRGFGRRAGGDIGLDRQCRHALAPPDQREFLLEFESRDLAERHRASVRERKLQRSQGRERDPLLVLGAGDDIDEIDVVAHLGDRRPGHHRVQDLGQRLRAQAQKPGLILIDLDAHLARRLHPVEIDQPEIASAPMTWPSCKRDRAHLRNVGTADPVLHRPADRRPKLQRRDARDDARQLLRQRFFELRVEPLPRRAHSWR